MPRCFFCSFTRVDFSIEAYKAIILAQGKSLGGVCVCMWLLSVICVSLFNQPHHKHPEYHEYLDMSACNAKYKQTNSCMFIFDVIEYARKIYFQQKHIHKQWHWPDFHHLENVKEMNGFRIRQCAHISVPYLYIFWI